MIAVPIHDNIISLSALDPERKMFDCLMPTPHGTTYNAYLVVGKKRTALIDTVDPTFAIEFEEQLRRLDLSRIDDLVILHTEQDHAGAIHHILRASPKTRIVCTQEVKKLVMSHLLVPDDAFHVVDEGDTIDLGGKSLTFYKIPFAHWPDNTMVYEKESGILFSNDLFGSHFASQHVFSTNSHEIKGAARAYYAEIMMPFSSRVRKYTEKVIQINPRIIATSHGPIWSQPSIILDKYMKWTGPNESPTIVIPYVSMHGSTHAMVEHVAWRLSARGLSVICRNLGEDPESLSIQTGHVANDLVTATMVLFASPTVLGSLHPAIAYCAMVISALKPQVQHVGLIGSYGWGTRADKVFETLTKSLDAAKRYQTLLVEGRPTEEDFEALNVYADEIANSILGEEKHT